MPKILRIINRLNLGGPTFNVAYLTKFLAPEYETLLVSGMRDKTEASSEFILQKYGIEPYYIKHMQREISLKADRQAYREIRQLIREFKPDIVHTHAAKAGAIGRLAAHNANVPVILHTFHGHVFHSYFGKLKTQMFLQVERFLANRSTRIIAISEEQKRELTEIYRICDAEKMLVVPLGIDLHRFTEEQETKRKAFREEWGIDDDTIAICLVGRLVPIKNHAMLMAVAKRLKGTADKKIRWMIVGDGEDRGAIEEMATNAGLSIATDNSPADVTFTSWIKDVDQVYAGCDLVSLTSLNEGTPVSLIEASASGKAIVSTDVGGVRSVVKEGETALLTKVNDIETFSQHLLSLINNEQLRNSFGEKARERVLQKFSYERLVNDFRTIYSDLLKSR